MAATDLAYASRLPGIELSDPLAELLGALEPGHAFRYTFEDAVRLCGHACPTVAAAWLLTSAALDALYPGKSPVRGDIEVVVGGRPDDGTAGPTSQVVTLVTGAAPDTGFGGLAGRYRRRGLLVFDPSLGARLRFRRRDTGVAVEVEIARDAIPRSPELGEVMGRVLADEGDAEDARRLRELWQGRVEAMLTSDRARLLRVRAI